MGRPNTLIFVDFPSPDPAEAARFYREVFGWEVEGRPDGVFYRIVPGGHFPNPDGTPSEVGNLHLGIYATDTAPPDPSEPPATGTSAPAGPAPRIYVMVGDDDDENAILQRAEQRGAEILWRDLYWTEFNGYHGAFRDPWGSVVILWTKGGDDPNPSYAQTEWESRKVLKKVE